MRDAIKKGVFLFLAIAVIAMLSSGAYAFAGWNFLAFGQAGKEMCLFKRQGK